jgi:hypothetical protein
MKVFCVYNPKKAIEQIDVMVDPAIDFKDMASRKVRIDGDGT